MKDTEYISSFSPYLFWDVKKECIDLKANAPFVVQRVLEFGQMRDWKILVSYYGLQRITEISKGLRTLEPKALSFISAISSTPREEFRCYTTRQLHATHLSF